MDITLIPLTDIDPEALPRDRQTMAEEALEILFQSILQDGLRQPIEVWPIEGPRPWALISGARRYRCFTRLAALNPERWSQIPCLIRQPAEMSGALALMVSENEIRAQVTPWEKGALLGEVVEQGYFPSLEAASEALYPTLPRRDRSRLRGYALVVEALDGFLTEPRSLSVARMDRLAVALRAGLADLMRASLAPLSGAAPARQWAALQPAITEAILEPDGPAPSLPTPGRPRRVLRLNSGITLRREWTPSGWNIRIDARHATHPGIVDDILEYVEKWFQKEG